MKDISVIYGYIAPYAAPVPSAYVLGVNVYHSILQVSGDQYWWVAGLAALVGMIGIESTGGLSAILVSRAFVQKSWSIMRLAILAVNAYAGFVAWGIYSSNESRPMITTVAITLLAYFVVALWEGMKELDKKKHDDANLALQAANARALELDAEVKRLEAERKLTNSQIRLEKASSGQGGQKSNLSGKSGGQSNLSGRQNGQEFDPVILLAVIEFLEKQSQPAKITVREIEFANLGIRKTAAALYKAEALRRIAEKAQATEVPA